MRLPDDDPRQGSEPPAARPPVLFYADTLWAIRLQMLTLLGWTLISLPLFLIAQNARISSVAYYVTWVLAVAFGGLTLLAMSLWRMIRQDQRVPMLQCCREGLLLRAPPLDPVPIPWAQLAIRLEEAPLPRLRLTIRPPDGVPRDIPAVFSTKQLRWCYSRNRKYLTRGGEFILAQARLHDDVRLVYRTVQQLAQDPEQAEGLASWATARF